MATIPHHEPAPDAGDHGRAPDAAPSPGWRARILGAGGLVTLLALGLPSLASDERDDVSADQTMQVLADLVLIDAQCPTLAVNFGATFRYAHANGIDPVEIMPLGSRRTLFEEAVRKRGAMTPAQDLCGPLAQTTGALVPGAIAPR